MRERKGIRPSISERPAISAELRRLMRQYFDKTALDNAKRPNAISTSPVEKAVRAVGEVARSVLPQRLHSNSI